jgi:protein-S-isoprenylcysteine O-methyltransferase Ste14
VKAAVLRVNFASPELMIRTQTILDWMWAAMGVYWLVSALGARKTEVNEARPFRIFRLLLLCLMFTLLLTNLLRMGWLAWRFIPDADWTRSVGIAVTAAGLALCVWARRNLGEYWSDKVSLKVDHQLIRSGPYSFLRHPIYSGVLLGIAGTALAIGEWRGVIVLVVMTANYWIKAGREDTILAGKFGAAFEEHRKRAGSLLPKL